MSYAADTVRRYWRIPWLRRHGIDMLRAEHIARWSFSPGDVVVKGWCERCGAPNHVGVVRFVYREGSKCTVVAHMLCQQGRAVAYNALFLKRALPPFSAEVLEVQHVVKKSIRKSQ